MPFADRVDAGRCLAKRLGQLDRVEAREREELNRRSRRYRGGRAMVPVAGRTVVVVDDGIATGSTAHAACEIVRHLGAKRIVLAVPVAPFDLLDELDQIADELVVVETPVPAAIGRRVVPRLLPGLGRRRDRAARVGVAPAHWDWSASRPDRRGRRHPVGRRSTGRSSRHPVGREGRDPVRSRQREHDLLTPSEAEDRSNVFDIELLSARLVAATRWLRSFESLPALPLGYFGASTGAGAALWAAAEPDLHIGAVVSRGGRPEFVIELNRRAAGQLRCEKRLAIVPRATHLFEEPGALEQVAVLARDWFLEHLVTSVGRWPGTVSRWAQ